MEWTISCQGCGTMFKAMSASDPEDAIEAWYAHSLYCPALAEKKEKEEMSKFQRFFTSWFAAIRKPFEIALKWTETKIWTLIFHVDKTLDRVRAKFRK